mmetsp:Transcript_32929/g.59618  ORF Transcript_32929/g.59618 Transcript_32929/m.59618 type:complete len:118 (+) Transcript_32929:236-589(+)
MKIPTLLTSIYGRKATIVPVKKIGGPLEEKWQVRSNLENDGRTAYAAQHRMAEFLGIAPSSQYLFHTTTPVTPPPRSSSKSKRPFDSFEPEAPTSQATCRAYKKPILKNTERIGVQL